MENAAKPSKKISRASLLNLILLTVLILVIVFGYFYFLKKNPVEMAASVVAPPDTTSYRYLYSMYGKGKLVLDKPEGIAYGNNRIWVADTKSRRVVVFDMNGEPLFDFGQGKDDKIKLLGPVNVLVDGNRVLVTDYALRNIVEYTLDGKLVGYFGEKDVPLPAALEKYKDMYVALDMAGPGLIFLDNTGKIVQRTFAGQGTPIGKLEFPQDIAVANNRIYITDSNNNRLVYTDDIKGPFKVAKVKAGSEFSFPYSIAVAKNEIFVGGALARAIKVYDIADELKVKTTVNEADKDGIGLGTPVSVAVDDAGRIYVVDVTHSRVMVYSK